MSATALSTHKLAVTAGNGENITNLNGWKHVGHYGSCLIYKKGNRRRLVDLMTGQSTFEYTAMPSKYGHSMITGEDFTLARDKT